MRKYEEEIDKVEGVRIGYYNGSGTQSLENIICNILRIEEQYGSKKSLTIKEVVDWISKDFHSTTKEAVLYTIKINWSNMLYIKEGSVYMNRKHI